MSTQSKTEHALNDLISISRDGKQFYEEAAQKVGDAELAALFTRIAGVKSDIVSSLSSVVQAVGGEPDRSGTLVGSLQQMYGKVRATLGDTKYGYVAELEESEDRLLKAFDEVIADQDTPVAARDAALALLPEVRACHDVMRNRKHAMKSAA
ncbi:PA2169 family four-helix-bundle protein [Xanthomonas sp. Kuri4-1]